MGSAKWEQFGGWFLLVKPIYRNLNRLVVLCALCCNQSDIDKENTLHD